MSVILVYEEFVSAFGSRSMSKFCESCKNLIKLFGTNEYAVPWRCKCNATDNPDNQGQSVQQVLSPVPQKHDPFAKWRDRFQYWKAYLRRNQ